MGDNRIGMKHMDAIPPVAFSREHAEQLFREGFVIVFCVYGQHSRHCISAAEAAQFFAEAA